MIKNKVCLNMYFPKLQFKSVLCFVFLNKVVFSRKTTTGTSLDKTGGMISKYGNIINDEKGKFNLKH